MNERTHTPQRVRIPRGLLILACCWIIASWGLIFGFRPPIQPQAASYGPSVQLFFTLLAVGISVAWPLLRLSGDALPPLLQSLFDAAVIGTVLQLILWPARLLTLWSVDRTGLLDIALCGILLSTASLLALSMATQRPILKAAWMLVFVVLAVLPTSLPSGESSASAFIPRLPNASLIHAIAQSSPTIPSDALRVATREAIGGSILLFWVALLVSLYRAWRARAREPSTCPPEEVV